MSLSGNKVAIFGAAVLGRLLEEVATSLAATWHKKGRAKEWLTDAISSATESVPSRNKSSSTIVIESWRVLTAMASQLSDVIVSMKLWVPVLALAHTRVQRASQNEET